MSYIREWFDLYKLANREINHEGLQSLDRILLKSATIEQFLENEQDQDEYYESLKNYFSSKNVSRSFPRKSYQAIIEQLKILVRQLPEFGIRAWTQGQHQGTFAIHTREQFNGKILNPIVWRIQRHQWLESLEKKGDLITDFQMNAALVETFNRIHTFEKQFQLEKARRPQSLLTNEKRKKNLKILKNNFYACISKDETLKKAAAKLLHRYLTRVQNQIFFEMIDADSIIYYFHNLRQHPRQVIPSGFDCPIPNAFLSILKKLILDPREMILDESLFFNSLVSNSRMNPRGNREFHYRTFPIRPFHSIWAGIFGKDCLGGAPDHLEKLTPCRWGIGVLKGTQTWFVEKNGRYQGFIRKISLRHPDHPKPLGNLEIWIPALTKSVLVRHEETSTSFFVNSLIRFWFELWVEKNIQPGEDLVISDSKLIDNEKIKETLFDFPAFAHGTNLEAPEKLYSMDLITHSVYQLIPPNAETKKYFRGHFAVDASLSDVQWVRILNTSLQKTQSLENRA